jgi:hypothetical protein
VDKKKNTDAYVRLKNIQFAHSTYDNRRVKLISNYAFSYESGTVIPHFIESSYSFTKKNISNNKAQA